MSYTSIETPTACRVAAITGGAGAIGGAIARALADAGHSIAILDREAEFPVDLAVEDDVRAAAKSVLQRMGRCDVLVHAAAAFDLATLDDLDRDTWRHVQAVNVESALWLCQELSPAMARPRRLACRPRLSKRSVPGRRSLGRCFLKMSPAL
jgi:NAD(P)-dependent dehydrogenase (short-subunit alcohol dehydrogenase family)